MRGPRSGERSGAPAPWFPHRSEEHTSELQSRLHLVCRLLLEKKKHTSRYHQITSESYSKSPYLRRPHHGRTTDPTNRRIRRTSRAAIDPGTSVLSYLPEYRPC